MSVQNSVFLYDSIVHPYYNIHTPFFSAKRQNFPGDLFRIVSYLRSGCWFSVGPTVRSYTMNVPTFKFFFLFGSGAQAPGYLPPKTG